MITITKNIIEEHIIWIPQCNIEGEEGDRCAIVRLPVKRASDGVQLEALVVKYIGEDFKNFYDNWDTDKYLVDLVFAKYGITADTSSITDFN